MNSERQPLRPEAELLLCFATTHTSPAKEHRANTLISSKTLDWELLLELASRNFVLPLFFANLKNTQLDIPDSVRERMRAVVRKTIARNLLLSHELRVVLHELKSHQIDAIPFRGPVLAAQAYGDIHLRHFGDLDILVRPEKVGRAMTLLESRGYEPQIRLRGKQAEVYCRREADVVFERPDGVILELHWRFNRKYMANCPPEHAWTRTRLVTFEETEVMGLDAELSLVYFCVHGAKHHWSRLQWLCDIAEWLRIHPELDWEEVVESAHRMGAERMLLLGLNLAAELLATDLPASIRSRIETDRIARDLTRDAVEQMLSDKHGRPMGWRLIRFHLRAKDRLRDKLQYLLRRGFETNIQDWSAVRLPDVLFPLYYLVRAQRLARRHLWAPIQACRGRISGRTPRAGTTDETVSELTPRVVGETESES